ncbi:guanine nucleotide-binding protein alpha subunit [Apiospora arundinis]
MPLVDANPEKSSFQATLASAVGSTRQLFCLKACQQPHPDQGVYVAVPGDRFSPQARQKLIFRRPDLVPSDPEVSGSAWTKLPPPLQDETSRWGEWQDVVIGKRRQAKTKEKRRSLDIERYLAEEEQKLRANFKVFTIGDQIQVGQFWEQLYRCSGLPTLTKASASTDPKPAKEAFDKVMQRLCEIHSVLCSSMGPDDSTHWLKELGNLLLCTGTPNRGFVEGVYRVWGDPAFGAFLGDHGILLEEEDHELIRNLAAAMSLCSFPREGELLARESNKSYVGFREITYDASDYSVHLIGISSGAWRKKWTHLYEDMTGVVFIASLLDYDKRLMEDDNSTLLIHNMTVFNSVCNLKHAADRPILLVLSNCWAFKARVRVSPLSASYPIYDGSNDPQEAMNYLVNNFKDLDRRESGKLFVKVVDVVDMSTVREMLEGFESTILREALTRIRT